jgi:hypothetical protein
MKTHRNIGPLWRTNLKQPWRQRSDEKPLRQTEFEQQRAEFVAYLDGVLFGLRVGKGQVYLEGNNYGERTHIVCAYDTFKSIKRLISALANWLTAPRREGWRIILAARKGRHGTLIIYRDCIRFSPRFATLDEAVAAY